MAKQLYQFHYSKDGGNQDEWSNGNAFNKNNAPIVKLTIIAPSTVQFYVNNDLVNPIMIGATGKFEIDLKNQTSITSLKFNKDDLENPEQDIIVNAIYNI